MKNRKKNILYTILIWVVILVGAYMYAHIDKMHTLYDEDVDTSSYIATGDLSKGVLEQTFLCEEDSLDGMSVKCQLFGDVTGIIPLLTAHLRASSLHVPESLSCKDLRYPAIATANISLNFACENMFQIS